MFATTVSGVALSVSLNACFDPQYLSVNHVVLISMQIAGVDYLYFLQKNTLNHRDRTLHIEVRNETFSNRVIVYESCNYTVSLRMEQHFDLFDVVLALLFLSSLIQCFLQKRVPFTDEIPTAVCAYEPCFTTKCLIVLNDPLTVCQMRLYLHVGSLKSM